MTKVFIDGREGTTGLKICERFLNRPDIELLLIPDKFRKDAAARKEYIESSDITFLCLPDAAAAEAAEMVSESRVRLIDASTFHRTNPDWAYGFPELSAKFRKKIENSDRVAVPGCHASGFVALVYPLISAGILPYDYPVSCHSLTGYSGGGKKMIAEYEDENRSELLNAPRFYGVTQTHKHLREMQYFCGLKTPPLFCPIVGDYYSGMEVSVPLQTSFLRGISSIDGVRDFFADYYAGQRLIEVMPKNAESYLSAMEMSGKNAMKIFVFGNDERIVLTSLFDNLGKGASGAAVQCMNVMLGIEETTGLI